MPTIMPRVAHRLRWIVAALGIALMAWGACSAALRGWADGHYQLARLALSAGLPGARAPDAAQWQAAHEHLRVAQRLEPDNPLFAEELGWLYERRALEPDSAAARARESIEAALARYRAAAVLRPGSPFVWANIALLKYRLDELDFEFYGALDRAERLGPWEPAVQRLLVDIGLAGWPHLAAPGREVAAAAIERGLMVQEAEIRRIIRLHAPQGGFCGEAAGRDRTIMVPCPR